LTRRLDSSITTLPGIDIDGYSSLNNATPSRTGLVYPSASGSRMLVRGEHTLRLGGEFRVLREANCGFGDYTPNISFPTNGTRGPLDSSAASPIGQGLASFLLGFPTGGFIDRNASHAQQSTYQGWFLHDDWKITRTLTLNLGLRYEYEGLTTERHDRSNRGLDLTTANPIEAQARGNCARSPIPEIPPAEFRTPGGLLFAAMGGQPRTVWNANRKNWAPRIGLAWLISPKVSVRAGYGIFHESLGTDRNDVGQVGYDQRTSLVATENNGQTFVATLSDPFPAGFLEPEGASAGLRTFLGRSPAFFTPERSHGYAQRWSLLIQRELGAGVLAEAGYAGGRGTRLGAASDYDVVPARYLSRSAERDQATIDFLSANVTNPFRGMTDFAGSAWQQSSTIQRSQLLTPFPHLRPPGGPGAAVLRTDGLALVQPRCGIRARRRAAACQQFSRLSAAAHRAARGRFQQLGHLADEEHPLPRAHHAATARRVAGRPEPCDVRRPQRGPGEHAVRDGQFEHLERAKKDYRGRPTYLVA